MLRAELEAKAEEIAALEGQLAQPGLTAAAGCRSLGGAGLPALVRGNSTGDSGRDRGEASTLKIEVVGPPPPLPVHPSLSRPPTHSLTYACD